MGPAGRPRFAVLRRVGAVGRGPVRVLTMGQVGWGHWGTAPFGRCKRDGGGLGIGRSRGGGGRGIIGGGGAGVGGGIRIRAGGTLAGKIVDIEREGWQPAALVWEGVGRWVGIGRGIAKVVGIGGGGSRLRRHTT